MCGGCGRKYQRPPRTAEQIAAQQTLHTEARRLASLRRTTAGARPRAASKPVVPEQIQTLPLKPPV